MSAIRSLFGKAASMLHLGRPQPGQRPTTSSARPRARDVEVIGRGSHAIRVEYSPSLDGDPDPGEVVWTWVPYEDEPSQGKDRPVVVIGRRGAGLVGIALTSRRNHREPQVALGRGAWDRDGRPSYANVDRIIEVDPGAMRREGAILEHDRFAAVLAGVRRQLEP